MRPDDDFDNKNTGFSPPKDLGQAYSLIQGWYMVESPGGAIDENFFNYDHMKAFARCGMHSAVVDTIVWTFGYIVLGSIALYIQLFHWPEKSTQLLFWTVNLSLPYLLVKVGSFSSIIFHTGLFVRMARLYTGLVCKKAIRTICGSRASFLFVFSICQFFALGLVYRQLTDSAIYDIGYEVSKFSPLYGERIYVFLKYYFKEYIFQASMIGFLVSSISFVAHFVPIMFVKFRKKKRRSMGPRG